MGVPHLNRPLLPSSSVVGEASLCEASFWPIRFQHVLMSYWGQAGARLSCTSVQRLLNSLQQYNWSKLLVQAKCVRCPRALQVEHIADTHLLSKIATPFHDWIQPIPSTLCIELGVPPPPSPLRRFFSYHRKKYTYVGCVYFKWEKLKSFQDSNEQF